MSNFNIYENMDKINADALMVSVFGTSDLDKVKLPKERKVVLKADGKIYTIKTKVSTRLKNRIKERDMCGSYDLCEALRTMKSVSEVREEINRIDPEHRTEAYDAATPEFDFTKLTKLPRDQIEQRFKFLVAVAGLILNEKTLTAIAEFAPKKKNGGFSKGKIARIVNQGVAGYFNSMQAIVGKAVNENTLEIILDERFANPSESGFLAEDFANTFIDELGISKYVEGLACNNSKSFDSYLSNARLQPVTEEEKQDLIKRERQGSPEKGNKEFEIINNVLVKSKGNHEVAIIPEGVTAIEKKAFYNRKKLKKVVIPDSCKSIGNNAFDGCNALEEVQFGNGIETIGAVAFYSCNLNKVYLGSNVKQIGPNAFCQYNRCYEVFSIESDINLRKMRDAIYIEGIHNFYLLSMNMEFIEIQFQIFISKHDNLVLHIRKNSNLEKGLMEYIEECRRNLESNDPNEVRRAKYYFEHPLNYEIID